MNSMSLTTAERKNLRGATYPLQLRTANGVVTACKVVVVLVVYFQTFNCNRICSEGRTLLAFIGTAHQTTLQIHLEGVCIPYVCVS